MFQSWQQITSYEEKSFWYVWGKFGIVQENNKINFLDLFFSFVFQFQLLCDSFFKYFYFNSLVIDLFFCIQIIPQ